MRQLRRRTACTCSYFAIAICATMAPGQLLAQSASSPSEATDTAQQERQAAPAASDPATGLEDIIVTARRSSENLQRVPVAVTVLSSEAIRSQALTSPADLNSKVPSLSVGTSNSNRDSASYSIRGQGQAFGGSQPAVITYFAEVATNVTGPGLLFDLQNIQVLKGPQGTLFGRNTTGGAILLEPKRPSEEFEGFIDLTAGSYATRRGQAAINVPLAGDALMVRAAVDINRRDGFTKDAVTGVRYDNRHYDAYRISLLARPFEGFENYTVFNYAMSKTNGAGSVLLGVNPAAASSFLFPALPGLLADQQERGPRRVIHSTPDHPFDRIKSWGVTNISTLELSDTLTLKNVFGYRYFAQRNNVDIDGSAQPLLDYLTSPFNFSGSSSQPSTEAYSEELQFQGKSFGDRLNWVIGGYVEWVDPESPTNVDFVTQLGSPPITFLGLKTDRSKAVFGQIDYDASSLIEGLKLTAGLRYTADKRAQISRLFIDPVNACFLVDGGPTCTTSDSAKFDAVTYNLSLQYQASPSTLFYATTRKGYKSGGFNSNAVSSDDRLFQPETVHDVEVGVKSQFAIGGMEARMNADLYRGKFTDIQLTRNIVVQGGSSVNITGNIGEGIIQGGELELTLLPARGVNLSVFYAYTDAHYTEVDFTDPVSGLPVDLTYLPFSNTPKNKVGVNASVSTELGSFAELTLGASYSYQSKVYFLVPLVAADQQDPQLGQKGYSLVNLRADLSSIGGTPLDLGVFVTNVTNKTYKIFENNLYPDAGVGVTGGLFGEPRMFGVSLRYRFGGA